MLDFSLTYGISSYDLTFFSTEEVFGRTTFTQFCCSQHLQCSAIILNHIVAGCTYKKLKFHCVVLAGESIFYFFKLLRWLQCKAWWLLITSVNLYPQSSPSEGHEFLFLKVVRSYLPSRGLLVWLSCAQGHNVLPNALLRV